MCSKKTTDKALKGIDITDFAISFLKGKDNVEKMTNDTIEKILNSDSFYVALLKKDNNLKKFKHSITGNKGHIKYITQRLYHPKTANWEEYNEDANKLKNLKDAYHAFYTQLQLYIKEETNEPKEVKDVLIAVFNSFENLYK